MFTCSVSCRYSRLLHTIYSDQLVVGNYPIPTFPYILNTYLFTLLLSKVDTHFTAQNERSRFHFKAKVTDLRANLDHSALT